MKPSAPRNSEQGLPPNRSAAVRTRVRPGSGAVKEYTPARRGQLGGEHEYTIEGDLSAHLEIATDELDAIARLLGDDLKIFLTQA